MRFVRIGLPILICLGGIVAIAIEPNRNGFEGGLLIVSAGLSVWLLNWLYRIGVAGERERDAEDEARVCYSEHGYWPDEAPPAGADPGTAEHPPDPHRRASDPHRSPGRGESSARRPPRRP